MPVLRSRKGGTKIGKRFRRSYRSSRHWKIFIRASIAQLGVEIMRTSTLIVSMPPNRSNAFSCRRWSDRICIARGSSSISSRNSALPSAISNRSIRIAAAPASAASSWPNYSLSSMPSGRAARLTLINGFLALGLFKWIASATPCQLRFLW